MKDLPDLPSELLQAAVNDLKLAEKSDDYEVDMRFWVVNEKKGPCTVCMAGALLCFTGEYESPFVEDVVVIDDLSPLTINSHMAYRMFDEIDTKSAIKMEAVNFFRIGKIRNAIDIMIHPDPFPQGMPETIMVHSYYDDRDLFFDGMNKIIGILKSHKL